MSIDGRQIMLQIWDTAGQERYSDIGPIYYRNARAAIAVCDVTKPATIEGLRRWIDAYRAIVQEDYIIMAANKCDLLADSEEKFPEMKQIADALGASCIMTSARSGQNVERLFKMIAVYCLDHPGTDGGAARATEEELVANTDNSCC
jgi:small GTP-binding protein